MSGRLEFGFEFGNARRPSEPEPDRPLRILVMGDFSGHVARRGGQAREPIASRAISRIDIDNFEELLQKLAPRLEFAIEGEHAPVALEFQSLDDFHPDRIYDRVHPFQELAALRKRLQNSSTFADAAAELQERLLADANLPPPATASAPHPPAKDDADLLDQILGGTRAAESPRAEVAGAVQQFVERVAAPHVTPAAGPELNRMVAAVDLASSRLMRAVLHNPAFQQLESLWRGLDKLVAAVGGADEVSIHLLDVTRDELVIDVDRTGDTVEDLGLYRLIVERSRGAPGSEPWSLLVGAYNLGSTELDVRLLGALGMIAARAGGRFLAAADSSVLGVRSLVETPDPREWNASAADDENRWAALRRSPVAASIGVALPRVLLRLPYGRKTDEIERFEFEELVDPAKEHEAYLWGNPALRCASLFAQAFIERGRMPRSGASLDLEGLPAYTYRNPEGDAEMKPCAEVFLTEEAARAVLARGVMPVVSYRNRDAARLMVRWLELSTRDNAG